MDMSIKAAYICGNCGGIDKDSDRNGVCNACGADFWVAAEDFHNSDLSLDYVDSAIQSLKVPRKELYKRLLKLSERSKFLRCPIADLPMYMNHPDTIVKGIVEKRMRQHW